jgi:transposase
MAPYSMDLRTRVLRDWDAGLKADAIAEKYHVSRAWVHRLQQRRRETGSVAPRRQTRWRTPILAPHLAQLETLIQEQPDRTLAELQAALGTTACLATIWRTVKQLGFTIKKNGARVRTGPSRRRRRAAPVADDHRHG